MDKLLKYLVKWLSSSLKDESLLTLLTDVINEKLTCLCNRYLNEQIMSHAFCGWLLKKKRFNYSKNIVIYSSKLENIFCYFIQYINVIKNRLIIRYYFQKQKTNIFFEVTIEMIHTNSLMSKYWDDSFIQNAQAQIINSRIVWGELYTNSGNIYLFGIYVNFFIYRAAKLQQRIFSLNVQMQNPVLKYNRLKGREYQNSIHLC